MADYPHPFLDREEANERMKILGFKFSESLELLIPGQEKQFQALMDLIAGAIAEWVDARPEGPEETWQSYNNELQEWAQEYLVG